MPTLEVPPYRLLERLFALLEAENDALLPGCRWLVLGARLGAIVAPGEAPTREELIVLLRFLRRRAPELEDVGRALVHNSKHGEDAYTEFCVDVLLETPDWRHPSQVLESPRPDFRKLLEACRARAEGSRGSDAAAAASVIERMELAVSIAENARERRERWRRGRQRKR